MEYVIDNHKYILHYADLKNDYERFRAMRDEEFLTNVIDALHFACVVCYFKEVSTEACLSDEGVIHQLVHLVDEKTREQILPELRRIRTVFERVCELA